MQTIKDILAHWPIFVAIGGAWAIVYATIRVKVPDIEKRLERIEKMELITKAHCADVQANCQAEICRKIDAIKLDLNRMDTKRQDARSEFHTELRIIARFMGKVEQFMADLHER